MPEITIKTNDGELTFPLTAKGWTKMIDWDELRGYQLGSVVLPWTWMGGRQEYDWHEQEEDGLPRTLQAAIESAIETLLCSKEFVDDRHACDDPYSVFHQIPETLVMRERLGETPHSFTELVRWASHDVR